MKPIRDLRSHGNDLAGGAGPTEGGHVAMRVMKTPTRGSWLRRTVTIVAPLAEFSGANAGLALSANPSEPGNALCPIDRAYGRVGTALGIHANPAAEPLGEVCLELEP